VIDQAYGDFCDEPDRGQLLHTEFGRRIVITRTLSKSYSLAGVRIGFAIAHPELIAGMRKVKDSYNCNTLSLAAALAALDDQQWMRENSARIRRTRGRLTESLRELGFHVVDSQANFVWATHPAGGHRGIYQMLKDRRLLVRYMQFPNAARSADFNPHAAPSNESTTIDGLRITIGTDAEIDQLLTSLKEIQR
jgi:histidinol-phosphate aminotransferase